VISTGSPPAHSNGSRKRDTCVPSGSRSQTPITPIAPVRTAMRAGPIGVNAGRPKNGTFTLSVRMF